MFYKIPCYKDYYIYTIDCFLRYSQNSYNPTRAVLVEAFLKFKIKRLFCVYIIKKC